MQYIINQSDSNVLSIPNNLDIGDELVFNNTATGSIGTISTFIIPTSGMYEVILWGANGSSGNFYTYKNNLPIGGRGAGIRGNLKLMAPDELILIIGQVGMYSDPSSPVKDGATGGSGGGTFLFKKRLQGKYTINNERYTLLGLAASGGGANDYGQQYPNRVNGSDASSTIFNYSASLFNNVQSYCSGSFIGSSYNRSGSIGSGGFGGGSATDDSAPNAVGFNITNRAGTNFMYNGGAYLGSNTDFARKGMGQAIFKLMEIYDDTVTVEETGPIISVEGSTSDSIGVSLEQVESLLNTHKIDANTHRNLKIDGGSI